MRITAIGENQTDVKDCPLKRVARPRKRFETCPTCHGTGFTYEKLYSPKDRTTPRFSREVCPQKGCHKGTIDWKEYYSCSCGTDLSDEARAKALGELQE